MHKNHQKGEYLEVLLRHAQTVFSTKEIAMIWGEPNVAKVRMRLYSYVKAGKLFHVRRGIYTKDAHYDRYELATKINAPSYISFETVLRNEGVVFQHYDRIFIASYRDRELIIDGQTYEFIAMKKTVLANGVGIVHNDGYAIATRERAFLDRLFVTRDYYFDQMGSISWEKVFELLPIYQSLRFEKIVRRYHSDYQKISLASSV